MEAGDRRRDGHAMLRQGRGFEGLGFNNQKEYQKYEAPEGHERDVQTQISAAHPHFA
jgi:hypothetical protein